MVSSVMKRRENVNYFETIAKKKKKKLQLLIYLTVKNKIPKV